MGNVIDKTFAILERLVSSSPDPMLPTQLADELGLNRATCSRLLKQLLDMGYILKVSRQQGYIAGPKILTMNNIARFQENYLKYAIPVIDHCAEELQASILTAQIYNGERYILYHKNRSPIEVCIGSPSYNDVFQTATGVLLAAYSDKEERIRSYRKFKKSKPKVSLDGFSTEKEMHETLDQIAKRGYVKDKLYYWLYAYPVFRNGKILAALGASITEEQYSKTYQKKICSVLQDAAEELTRKLTTNYTLG